MDSYFIANTVLHEMWEINKDVRPMKLQKLIYYFVGFYYKEHGEFLPDYDFYKWDYGPVIPEVYHEFSKFKYHPINSLYQEKPGLAYIIDPETKPEAYFVLREVLLQYGDYYDSVLSKMTHKHISWKQPKMYTAIDKGLIKETFDTLEYGQ